MRDNIRTPPGTETVCERAADEVGELLRGTELYPEKSLFEMLMSLRRLLIDTSIATGAGNRGDTRTAVLALTDVVADAQAVARNLGRGLDALVTSVRQADDGLLPEHPSIAWHEPTSTSTSNRNSTSSNSSSRSRRRPDCR